MDLNKEIKTQGKTGLSLTLQMGWMDSHSGKKINLSLATVVVGVETDQFQKNKLKWTKRRIY
jgi:hypothetical protein